MSSFAPGKAAQTGAPPTQSTFDLLHSTFVSSSAAPSQEYERLCKVVLQRRLRNLFALSTLAAAGALAIAIFDPRGLPSSLFNIVPVVLFAPIAFLGTLPVLVLRKQTITTVRPPLPTLFARLAQVQKRTIALPIFVAYLIASVTLHFAYIWAASWASQDARLGWFFFHQGRDAWQLNERRLVLSLFHLTLAAWATVQHITEDRSQVAFDDDGSLAIPARLAARSRVRLAVAIRSAMSAWVVFWSGYVLFRRPVLRFFLAHVLPVWSRSNMYAMMRHNGSYSITLAARAFSSGLFIFLAFEATHVLFEVYATQPMTVSQFGSNPNQVLLSGLRSSDPYYQQFAFLDLATLTLRDASRRQAIFKDVKPGSATGGAWAEISRECLLLLGTELQRVRGRGRLPDTSSSAAPTSSSTSGSSAQAQQQSATNRAAVKAGDVFQPTRATLFDKLAAVAGSSSSTGLGSSPAAQTAARQLTEGPAAQQAQQAISTALNVAGSAVARVPSILQTSSLVPTAVVDAAKSVEQAAQTAVPASSVVDVVGTEHSVARFVPGFLRAGIFDIAIEYRVKNCVKRRHEVVCAVQALSNLICASLTEDPYGVAQRDIPKVLEAFVRFLSSIKALSADLEAAADAVAGGREEKERARRLVEKEVGDVEDALRAGTKAILTEFAEYLGEFRFPTQIAAQLQLLVDWGG
ncbi:hypothetical protein JCM10908_001275 [Rhodotorula pacifica]|uniref:nucleoporin NDC1 n=1 Tax=Rhodotorula pacifica TaxID=1495444 RepID=UPI003180061B